MAVAAKIVGGANSGEEKRYGQRGCLRKGAEIFWRGSCRAGILRERELLVEGEVSMDDCE